MEGILILLCIGLIVIVGLSAEIFSPNKTTKPIANSKTYSDHGLTFNYPDSWTINEQIKISTTPNGGTGMLYDGSLQEYASRRPTNTS